MDVSQYKDKPNRLLVEIGFTAAQYGLTAPAMSIAKHLGSQDNTRAASMLIMGVLNIAMRAYDDAKIVFAAVLATPLYEPYHAQARELLGVLEQVAKQNGHTLSSSATKP